MNMTTTQKLIKLAIDHWMHTAGEGALQPNQALCTLAKNGTVWLKNINGHLGFVTTTGKCFTRIGSNPIDAESEASHG